jgi:hypothetical protein
MADLIYKFMCPFYRVECFREQCNAYRGDEREVNTPFGPTKVKTGHPMCLVLEKGWVMGDLVIKGQEETDW